MSFRTVVELGGKTATGLEVPAEVVGELGSSRRPAVRVSVGGQSYTTTVATMGGRFLVPLSAENRTAAGVAAGDAVEVDIELDEAPREVVVPPDLEAALDEEPAARVFFASSPSRTARSGCGGSRRRRRPKRGRDGWRRPWRRCGRVAGPDRPPGSRSIRSRAGTNGARAPRPRRFARAGVRASSEAGWTGRAVAPPGRGRPQPAEFCIACAAPNR